MDTAGPITRNEVHCALAAETLRKSGKLRFRAVGSSMVPVIWPGDILEVRSVEFSTIEIGDVVLFSRGQSLCAHRVEGISESSLITRGYSVSIPDPPVNQAELLGRVIGLTRNGRQMRISSKLPIRMLLMALAFRRCGWLLRAWIRCRAEMARMPVGRSEQVQEDLARCE